MDGMKYGYARVSTDDQNADMQHAALKKDRCKKIITDTLPGGTTKRPALLRCLKTLKHGDSLTVWKLDRLGRSLRDLITMLDDLKHRGVKFRSLTEAIDTKNVPLGSRVVSQKVNFLGQGNKGRLISSAVRRRTGEYPPARLLLPGGLGAAALGRSSLTTGRATNGAVWLCGAPVGVRWARHAECAGAG